MIKEICDVASVVNLRRLKYAYDDLVPTVIRPLDFLPQYFTITMTVSRLSSGESFWKVDSRSLYQDNV